MKSSIITGLVGALAVTVNGVPIIDNANQAVTKSAQAGAASVKVVYGLVHRHLTNIQGPGSKMPVSVSSMNSFLSGASALTEIKTDTPTGPFTIHMAEAVSATFDTSVTGTKAKVSRTDCVFRHDPHSTRINNCLGEDSEASTTKPVQLSDMPAQTSSPVTTSMDHFEYDDRIMYWFVRCLPLPVERRPKDCATMKPSPMETDSLPTLELITLTTDISSTLTGEDTTASEIPLELTTISSMITPTPTKEATVNTSEPLLELTTIASLMTPTPTPINEGVIIVTVTSTVILTEVPEIEYTSAEVASASTMALRG
ncbi:hypothetical protein LZ30DRAFT_778671 [Colletotrichum cereale]|nr:hypothetical protein LZ30DRAFT_778671 [Colletotrichum cereale]